MVTVFENKHAQEYDNLPDQTLQQIPEITKPEQKTEPPDPEGVFSAFTFYFLTEFEKRLSALKETGEPVVRVSEVLGGLARLYEKIRTVVEYKGEHVLRRNAIERILKRLIWEQGTLRSNIDSARVATALTKELIWARYLLIESFLSN